MARTPGSRGCSTPATAAHLIVPDEGWPSSAPCIPGSGRALLRAGLPVTARLGGRMSRRQTQGTADRPGAVAIMVKEVHHLPWQGREDEPPTEKGRRTHDVRNKLPPTVPWPRYADPGIAGLAGRPAGSGP